MSTKLSLRKKLSLYYRVWYKIHVEDLSSNLYKLFMVFRGTLGLGNTLIALSLAYNYIPTSGLLFLIKLITILFVAFYAILSLILTFHPANIETFENMELGKYNDDRIWLHARVPASHEHPWPKTWGGATMWANFATPGILSKIFFFLPVLLFFGIMGWYTELKEGVDKIIFSMEGAAQDGDIEMILELEDNVTLEEKIEEAVKAKRSK